MISIRQRYQKIRNGTLSARFVSRHCIAALLVASVAGCSNASDRAGQGAGTVAAVPNLESVDLRRSLVPFDRPAGTQLAVLQPLPDVSGLPDPNPPVPPEARQAVVGAYEALKKKQYSRLADLVPIAESDPQLGDYPRYWSLSQQLSDSTRPIPESGIQQFIRATENSYLADRLKGEWIVAAVRAGDYAKALDLAPVTVSNASIECSLLLARQQTGQTVTSDEAMAAFSPTRACWTMLDQFAVSNVVGWDALSFELRAILETSRTSNAQRLAAIMFDGAEMVHYAALMKDPKKWLSGRKAPNGRAETELVTIALSRLARGDARDANAGYIEKNWAHAVPERNMEWVWSQFGLVAALNVDVEAAKWYRRSGSQRLTDYNHAWEVRAELRRAPVNWERVEAAILRMTERQASEPVWVYWLARAHDAQGRPDQAKALYASIANQLDFYGQLANEELGHAPFIPALPSPVTRIEFQEARANPGLQRAIALFDQGWRPEAVREWNFALRGMDDRQLLAAAELARHEHIYDRVVNTSLRTKNDIDFTQRFVAPFEGRVTEKAREINLDPAWVYGLIRQESRFITDARSRVGASGLMQLMPATARWVAKKIGMTNFKPSQVNEFETNTVLGTNYLRMVLDDLGGSEVLATAGYNAGPGRPIRWRSRLMAPVEGAIFAETIPFTETRLYVKNVMSNAVYYSMLFTGQPQSLKERLGVVAPSANRTVALP